MKKVMKAVAALMLMTAVVCVAGCTKDDPNNGGNNGGGNGGTLNGHQYVDLGLPSGIQWATCNVGANSPEDYGDYFAWGETQPKTNGTYNWLTYKFGDGDDFEKMTKYCTVADEGFNGFVDNLTVLLPEDDAATVNWGSGWRMATKEEWEELILNTTHSLTTKNGVEGISLVGPNGNSLFLPAAGYNYFGEYDPGEGLAYWSSSLADYPQDAWCFGDEGYVMPGSDLLHEDECPRCDGFSVRAVCSQQTN